MMNIRPIKLSPSLLAADFSKLGEEVAAVDQAGADYIHIDVMDGMFVPNISMGFPVMESIRKVTKKVFDVHLMVEEPLRYIQEFKDAGADIITVHAEACKHLDRTLSVIKSAGCKCGVALNPATPLNVLDYIWDKLDMVLIMTVNPGYGGQKYIAGIEKKVKELKSHIDSQELDIDIQVDGGITAENVRVVLNAGANIIVSGSAIFKGNLKKNVDAFKLQFEEFINE